MYVIDEEGLRVDQFAVDAASGILSYTNISLAVTPFGKYFLTSKLNI